MEGGLFIFRNSPDPNRGRLNSISHPDILGARAAIPTTAGNEQHPHPLCKIKTVRDIARVDEIILALLITNQEAVTQSRIKPANMAGGHSHQRKLTVTSGAAVAVTIVKPLQKATS